MQIYNRERCTVLQILRIQLCFGGYKFRLLASLMRHQIINLTKFICILMHAVDS
jgi:hypothetical protein